MGAGIGKAGGSLMEMGYSMQLQDEMSGNDNMTMGAVMSSGMVTLMSIGLTISVAMIIIVYTMSTKKAKTY